MINARNGIAFKAALLSLSACTTFPPPPDYSILLKFMNGVTEVVNKKGDHFFITDDKAMIKFMELNYSCITRNKFLEAIIFEKEIRH